MFGHRIAQQTRQRQAMFEFGRSGVHLRRAAAHLVVGTAELLTPTYDRAMLMAGRGWYSTHGTAKHINGQMRQGAAESRAMRRLRNAGRRGQLNLGPRRSRWKRLSGLLVAGAAVGAAGAAVARSRRTQESDEYQPKIATSAATIADSLSSRASHIVDSLHERS